MAFKTLLFFFFVALTLFVSPWFVIPVVLMTIIEMVDSDDPDIKEEDTK